MASPVTHETQLESTSPPPTHGCFGTLLGRKVKKEVPGHPTEAFRREFRANSDHSTDLIRSRPIRYNQDTKQMEVASNSGIGIVWKPIKNA